MDPSSENAVKQQDQNNDQPKFTCTTCLKDFNKETDLNSHIKLKHNNQPQKPKQTKAQPKNRILEMQQNQHEDVIYAYLGELGEKHQQGTTNRLDIVITDENQKLTGQTNYSVNKVVRTPYEKEIDPIACTPHDLIKNSKFKDFFDKLTPELAIFHKKVDEEKDKWQEMDIFREFRDPMAPEEQTEDQFSLMDIRKMINNYPRRDIKSFYPHFSIFLLWIGRICKVAAWQQIFMIVGEYLGAYYSWKCAEEESGSKSWQAFSKKFEEEDKCSIMQSHYQICDAKTIKKLAEYYVKWVHLFGLTKFC